MKLRKTKHYIGLILLTLCFFQCKNKTPIDDLRVVEVEALKLDVYAEVTIVAEKEDYFQLFYTTDGTTDYGKGKNIIQKFKGSPKAQTLIFTIPKEDKPTNFRLDIGQNKNQIKLTIEKFVFSYYEDKIEINKNELKNYFSPNYFITQHHETNEYVFNKTEEGYDPFLYCEPLLVSELSNLINTN